MRHDTFSHVFFRRLLSVCSAVLCMTALASPAYAAGVQRGELRLHDLLPNISAAHTQSTLSLSPEQTSRSVHFPVTNTSFTYNAIGIVIEGTIPKNTVSVTLTTEHGEVYPFEFIGDEKKDNAQDMVATAPLIVDPTRSIQLSLTLNTIEEQRPEIADIRVIYINTVTQTTHTVVHATGESTETTNDTTTAPDDSTVETTEEITEYTTRDGYTVSSRPLFSTPPSSSLAIHTRDQWDADESYRYSIDPETEESIEIWPAEYSAPQAFIVHHSAGSDGGDDPAATVRAIYYFHAVVYGWGDIGYHYIIDPAGTIYEGRYGGDGVIGGHAYNSQTNIGFNTGSVGIMLLGCYEHSSACTTPHTPTTVMLQSLQTLIAEKAELFAIKTQETITFHGTTMNAVDGHLAVSATLCPGNAVMEYLPTLRAAVSKTITDSTPLHNSRIVSAQLFDATASKISVDALQPNTDYTLKVTLANTGYRRWLRKNSYLIISNGESDETPTRFLSSLWPATDGRIKWDKGKKKVFRYETTTFTIPIHTPTENYTEFDVAIHFYTHVKYAPHIRDVGGMHIVSLTETK